MAITASRTPDVPVPPPGDLGRLIDLAQFLDSHEEPAVLLGPDGEQAPLLLEIYQILVQVVDAMQEGKAITVAPLNQKLTTQEAADILGISRPTLVKLLDEHELPFERPSGSRHRRLKLQDVLDYRDRRSEDRRRRLAEMTRQAADEGLDEISMEEAMGAIRQGREKSDH